NIYNIDEVGFLLGLDQSEHVLEVIQEPRESGELKYCAQSMFFPNSSLLFDKL
ncbi:hypothetical protein C7212DRAFT_170196, partial [Tuber magnatum]